MGTESDRIKHVNDLADITLAWFKLPKKDRQYGINILLARGLVKFNDHLELVLVNGDEKCDTDLKASDEHMDKPSTVG